MPTTIKWLRTALRNLGDELGYISNDDEATARAVARRIKDAVALLATQPSMGRPGRVTGTRELIVPRTIIPYRVRGGAIEIMRAFHASRRPPKRW